MHDKFQENCSKPNTAFCWGATCRPRIGVSPPKIKFYIANPPQGAIFVCWPPPYSKSIHPHLVEWTLQAPGLGEPPEIKFYWANPPGGAIFVCWPPPYSKRIHPHLVECTLRAPGLGEPPKNKFYGKPTSKSNFCLLVPAQLLTLQGISDGVTVRGTSGADILGHPLAWCRARVK